MRRLTLFALAWLMLQPAALAFEFRSGDDVLIPAGTTIRDDLYVAGGNVRVEGDVLGDLVVAGGDVTVTGRVREDLVAAGGTLDLRGRVGQSVRAAGGTLKLRSTVGKDVLLAGGNVTQENEAHVAGDGAYAGGHVIVGGSVGEARLAGGDLTLRGRMGATDAYTGTLKVEPGARIDGPLTYTSEASADIAPGAVITGGVTHHAQTARHRPHLPGFGWGWWVAMLIASLVSGAVLALLLPRAAARVADQVETQPLMALLIGFALVVATPVALLFLMVTVVGIPLALVLLGVYLVLWHVAWLVAGLSLGDAFLRRRTTFKSLLSRLMAALAFGLPVLLIVQLVPILGWLVAFVAVCVGFGGVALAVGRGRTEGPPAPVPSAV